MLFIIYCGRSIPQTKKVVSKKEIIRFLTNQNHLKYWTLIDCQGGWVDELTKLTIIEKSIKLEYYSENENDFQKVKSLAEDYKSQFFQDSVLVVVDYKKQIWI